MPTKKAEPSGKAPVKGSLRVNLELITDGKPSVCFNITGMMSCERSDILVEAVVTGLGDPDVIEMLDELIEAYFAEEEKKTTEKARTTTPFVWPQEP